MRYKDSNSRRSMIVYSSKNSSILIPLNTLVSKLDSSFESGSKMDRSLSELTMKIFDVSLLENPYNKFEMYYYNPQWP